MAIESFPAPTQISYFTASRRHINYFPSPTVPAGRISARGVPDGDNKLHFKAVLETDTQHFAHFSARRYPKTVFGGRKRDHHIEFRAKSCVTVANGTSKDEYGRCPIRSGMTGMRGVAGNGRRTFHCFNEFYVYLQVVWRDVSTFYEHST